jgi:prepilin-type N-terminal cleavage/methylation domain-containing protein
MSRDDTQGFTLIEVLVAFTIAVVLLAPLLHSFSTGLNSISRTDRYTEASAIARSAFEALGPELTPTDAGGSTRQTGPYHISTKVRPYHGEGVIDGPALPVVPYEVAVTVGWRDGRHTRSVALHGIRLGAAPSQEATP